MHNISTDEVTRRKQFFDDFGRYLPGSLCPAIMEEATKFVVQPPELKSKLPKLMLTESEEQHLQQKIATQALDDGSRSKTETNSWWSLLQFVHCIIL